MLGSNPIVRFTSAEYDLRLYFEFVTVLSHSFLLTVVVGRTRSGQEVERWRQALQRGSLVDALDPNNTWTNATVMDTRERMGAPVVVGVGPMGGDSAGERYPCWCWGRAMQARGALYSAVNTMY